jgi:hypothetical protein
VKNNSIYVIMEHLKNQDLVLNRIDRQVNGHLKYHQWLEGTLLVGLVLAIIGRLIIK